MLGFADNRGTSLGLHIFLRGVDQMITRASLAFVVVLVVGLSGQPVDAQDSKDSKGVMVKGLVTSLGGDRKSTRLNSSHGYISYAVFCLKKKKKYKQKNVCE